ncbi:MAG: MFS transporter, partial [Alphaproteobacteria bacterium]|nr:MFS transporter [Alphaproteobacteria bacterium]
MNKRFEFYYLQRGAGGSWDTLEQSGSAAVLTDRFTTRLAANNGESYRIVGAVFDEAAGRWDYQQLAFVDPPSVDLEIIGRTEAQSAHEMVAEVNEPALRREDPGPMPLFTRPTESGQESGSRPMAGETQIYDMRLAYLALIIGGVIVALAFGIRSGFSIFLGPISQEFGYGREIFALSLGIQNLVWGVTQPFTSAFGDRFGVFWAVVVGALFFAAGTVSMAFSSTPEMFHLGAGVLVGVGLSGTGTGIIFGAVNQLFPPEKRSWALGVVGAAGSLGHFLILPIGQQILASYGWNILALVLGILVLAIIPMGCVFRKAKPVVGPGAGPSQSIGEAIRQAFTHPSFWFLCLGFFVCGFHVTYIYIHLPAYVVDLGFTAQTGAWALAVVGLANVVGSYSAGVLGGKFSKKYLLSGLYLGRAVIMAGFVLLPPSEILVYVFAVLMGIVWLSTVPLTSGLVGDIYGA